MKRRFTTVLFALFGLLAAMLSSASAIEGEEVVIEGGGWGHGIGMSQYGAYGQALEGKTAEEIVGYYYEGSSTAQIIDQVGAESWLVTDPRPLWVSLLAARPLFQFEAIGGTLTVCHSIAGGCTLAANPGEVWKFVTLGDGTCQFLADDVAVSSPAACRATVKGLTPQGAHIEIGELDTERNEFARGIVRIRTPDTGATIHVALEIALEHYLYGLAEVPFSWHEEALRAQALAGRSYATWRLISRGPEAEFSNDRKTECWCHMYATTADQSYSGWANEDVTGASAWRGAVDSTAGTVITHPAASQANVVAAFYSSSTGGRTENVEDMWGGNPVSYLRSQADPWSNDPAVNNPFGEWAFPFTEDALAEAYEVDKIDGITIVERFASGTPSLVEVYARSGGTKTTIVTSGPEMFTMLGLRGRNISGLDYGRVPALSGDFSGDGRGDVAMVTPFNRTWWIGTSTPGEFAMSPWLNHTAGNAFSAELAGDFNGDNIDDIAAMQAGTGKLLIGLSTGARFDLAVWANHAVPQRWGSLLVGDFDGNGSDDIAEYDTVAERWRVYRLHDGELVKGFWYDFAVSNPNWAAHAVGDYNGDDRADILSLDGNTGDLIVLLSDGHSFAPSTWQTLPNSGDWQSLQAADFTGDGIDDVGAYDPVAATWWIVAGTEGTAGATPAAWFTWVNPDQDFVAQLAGDFDADGSADIAAYNSSNGRIKVLTSTGSGFAKSVWGRIPARDRIDSLLVVDVNGNGKTDIAAWDNALRRWWVARAAAGEFAVTPWGTLLR